MASAEELRKTTKVVMFDQYGTVVDMQEGLTAAFAAVSPGERMERQPRARFVTWWRRTHFENSMIDGLLHREHTPYREIGFRALAYTLDRAGIPYTTAEVSDLISNIERLEAFPGRARGAGTGCSRNTRSSCCPTATPTCWKLPSSITSVLSTR